MYLNEFTLTAFKLAIRAPASVLFTTLVLLAPPATARGDEIGVTKIPIVFQVGPDKRELKLVFSYCPPPVDGPDKGKIRPFYMAQTEITQGQFLDLVSRQKESWAKPRLADLGVRSLPGAFIDPIEIEEKSVREGLAKDKEKYSLADNSKPIYGVSIIEAALFCRSLGKLPQQNPPGLLIDYRFRLPTRQEWDYACIGRQIQAERDSCPYFHSWPTEAEVVKADENIIKKCEALWKKLELWKKNTPTKFEGTQKQLMTMVDLAEERTNDMGAEKAGQDADDALKYFGTYLEVALKLTYFKDWCDLGKSDQVNENKWNISGMHGNVSEWTLADRRIWDLLVKRLEEGDDSELKMLDFFHSGGSFDDLKKPLTREKLNALTKARKIPYSDAKAPRNSLLASA